VSYNEWLDIDVLEDYLDGKLDAKTMHKVERLSLEDPFVAEALAGLSQLPKRTHTLSLLQKQLQERIVKKPIERKRWTITSHRLSIAAAAAVLFVTVSILFLMKENSRKQLSDKQVKKVDVTVAPEIAAKLPIQSAAPVVEIDKNSINNKNIKEKSAGPAIIDKFPKIIENETQVAVVKPASDSVALLANNAKRTAEVEALKFRAEESKMAALKRREPSREVALISKLPGIAVENGVSGSQRESIINGRVYTKNDRQPMPGVTVRVSGSNKVTTTNSKGEFTLPVDSNGLQSLSIAYLGFTTKVVNTKANQSVEVELEQNQNSLNEVAIVSGYKKEGEKEQGNTALAYTLSSAYYPLGGWPDYQSYLANNNNLTKNGLSGKEVALKFEVKTNGEPTKIEVVKSQGKLFDAEAIRLLKDGPKWLLRDKDKKSTTQIVVKF
jgi:hypothetical protein